ncbi:MAG: hypothetical protein ACI9CD_000751 [Candidatus Deianiraeaceae bacterium]|jgi:hypothetical protein
MQVLFKIVMYVALLVGCAKAPDGWTGSRFVFMRIHPDQRYGADHDWTKGFNDGCKTAASDAKGVFQLMKPEIDGWKLTGRDPNSPESPHPEIKSSKVYGKGWFDGFEHCTYEYDWWVL